MAEREVVELDRLLQTISPLRVLERRGFMLKRDELVAQVARMEQFETGAVAVLIFNGEPVVGSFGIDAEFGATAVRGFEQMVSRIYEHKQRAERPIVPGAGKPPKPKLHITNVVHGSFGFELREIHGGMLVDTDLAVAVDNAVSLVRAAYEGDEEFTTAVAAQGKRVAVAVRNFLVNIHQHQATLRLRGTSEVVLDAEKVGVAAERARTTEITEDEDRWHGVFKGLLTATKTFEFELQDGTVMHGSVTPELDSVELTSSTERRAIAVVKAVHARHAGRVHSKYTLVQLILLGDETTELGSL